MIEVERLGRRWGSRWLFRCLSFRVEPGQVLTVLGPNGSGKSTLLRIVAGLLSPSEGRVVAGRESLGYAALDLALYPALSAPEHLQLAADLRGCEPRCEHLLADVGLEPSEQPVGEFSSGMRARLRLALALQSRPSALLLDEPGASLDEDGRAMVARLISESGAAVMLATNDPQERRLGTHELALVD